MAEHDVDIARLFDPDSKGALDAYLRLLHPADIAELFNHVHPDNWTQITARLRPETLAEVFAHLDEGQRSALASQIQTERLIRVVDELDSDDAADVLADLPEDKMAAVLEGLSDGEALQQLLRYPPDTAGGIMQTELCRVREDLRVSDAIEALRKAQHEQVHDIHRIYLVDGGGRLRGVVRLEDLVLADEKAPLASIRQPIEYQVTPDMDQEEVAQIFRKYDFATLPVVDVQGVLLGRITFDDIHDVLEEEASEDIMTMAGVSPDDLVYTGRFVRIALFRLPWLLTSMMGSLVTAYLLSLFSHVTSQALILVSFVPVVMAMTGNVGAQSAMIVTRGFAVGRVEFGTLGRTFLREVRVGLIMGMVAGICVGVVAHQWHHNLLVGAVVATSLVCSMAVAATVGAAAPAAFKRVGVDPAIAAGPLVTTGCDILGVGTYLLITLLLLT